jgi:hypothetical protein
MSYSAVSQVVLPYSLITPTMLHSKTLNTSLLEVMISSKNEPVFIHHLSNLTLPIIFDTWWVALPTFPNARVGFGSDSDPGPNRCNGSYHTKTWTVAIGLVLPSKTRHINNTSLAPTKYLSSDCIVT